VIVRINDRGPFHSDRLIDLSYAAAVRLGVNITGTAPVEVRAIDPDDPDSDHAGAGNASASANSASTDSASADRLADPDRTRPGSPPRDAPASAANAADGYLQVASFGARDNAEHLRSRLRDAGIDGAALREVDIDGRALWRVLIGPLQAAAAAQVAAHVEAMGLGHPQFFSASGRSD
jgi:rare lipoprotein A